jgi:hypothetical protein
MIIKLQICNSSFDYFNGSQCVKCPTGKITSLTNVFTSTIQACQGCLASQYMDTLGNCLNCLPGKWSNASATVCIDCNPGTVWLNASLGCVNCPSGKYSNISGLISMSNCTACGVGSFSLDGSSVCGDCPAGTFVVNTSCIQCPVGYYAQFAKSPGCSSCPSGKFSNSTGSTYCRVCSAGYFSTGGAVSCSPCQPGNYSFAENSAFCTPCSVGDYSASIATTTCLSCPRGKFGGGVSCSACSNNSTTQQEGSQSTSDCFCAEGTYGRAYVGEECKSCLLNIPGVICPSNGSFPVVEQGYFRSQIEPSLAYLCSPKQACANVDGQTSTSCSDGYTGDLCGSCIIGYSYRQGLVCQKCPSKIGTIVVVLGIVAVFVLVVGRFIKTGFRVSAEMKVAFLWIQIIATYPSFSSNWPSSVMRFFDVMSFSNLDFGTASPGECFIFPKSFSQLNFS